VSRDQRPDHDRAREVGRSGVAIAADGMTTEQILAEPPDLEPDNVAAALVDQSDGDREALDELRRLAAEQGDDR